MQNLIKLAMWMAPAFLLALVIILGRIDHNNAQMDVETAAFDQQFTHQQSVLSEENNDKQFWQQEEAKAAKRQKDALGKKVMAEGKVSQQTDILERTLRGMDKENKK